MRVIGRRAKRKRKRNRYISFKRTTDTNLQKVTSNANKKDYLENVDSEIKNVGRWNVSSFELFANYIYMYIYIYKRKEKKNSELCFWPTVAQKCNGKMSHLMTKPTKWHVRPAKTQTSLGIRQFDQSFCCPQEESLGP